MPTGVYKHKKGWKHSEETKRKIGIANKGKQPMLGKCQSLETRNKIRIANLGENSPNWKGGISPINERIRKSAEFKRWRENVFVRDNYTCVFCGKRSGNGYRVILHPDHIKSFAYFPELRFKLSNGRTLCIDCHRKTDNYGYKAVIIKEVVNQED